jgi:hypothetical protein
VREGEEYRDTLASGHSITWTVAPGPSQSCTADADAVRIVRDAVNSSAAEIAQVDFSALSLPRFLTVTRTLKLDSTSWQSVEVEIDACGSEGGIDKWRIYSVLGPEFEQLPGGPGALIHRWPHVYALYDVEARAVKKLLVSIRGYVLE